MVTVTNSTISDNVADGGGGGLFSDGTLAVTGSTIADNAGTASVSYGGGIWKTNASRVIKIANSTISGNSAVAGGGGVFHAIGALTVTNSTITANTTPGLGGGLYVYGSSSTRVALDNSVVAGNTGSDNSQVYGAVSSASSHNLIGFEAGMSGIRDGVNGNQVGVDVPLDPMLGPLADHGGATRTHAPLPGSPLIDAGGDAEAVDRLGLPLALDQRGLLRRFGTVDIGAVEAQPPGVPIARGDGFVGDQGESITLDVLANDFCNDGSPLEARIVAAPSHGTLTENPDGTLTYTPEASFWGTDTFSYQAVNGELASDRAEVVLSVLSPTSIIVTMAADEDDGDLSPDDISLREALAMASPGATIQFSAALLDQVIEIQGGSFAPVDVTIIGLGTSHLTIRRDRPDRAVYVYEGASSISYLTITGRGVQANSGGRLSLDHVVLTGCSHSFGGGIRAFGGTVTVTNSIVAGNSASSFGGGICVQSGTVTIIDSTVSANSAWDGGGIYNESGTVTVVRSTIADNLADSLGGGIHSSSGMSTVMSLAHFGQRQHRVFRKRRRHQCLRRHRDDRRLVPLTQHRPRRLRGRPLQLLRHRHDRQCGHFGQREHGQQSGWRRRLCFLRHS